MSEFGKNVQDGIASFFNHLACLPRYRGYSLREDMPQERRDFFLAAMTGDLWAIRRTVKKNPEAPRWTDNAGFTGLMFAAREGRGKAADFLLPLSNLRDRTDFGWDALRFSQGSPHGVASPAITAKIRQALQPA